MNKYTLIIQGIILLFYSMICQAGEVISVYTVNYPLEYFSKRIGGEYVDVNLPVPANIDPAYWRPSAKIISAYQQADVVFLNGAGYDRWTNYVSLPRRRLVNTSAGFESEYIKIDVGLKHSHGPGEDHAHEGTAFTTWLDFKQAIVQAEAITAALSKSDPTHASTYTDNMKNLKEDLLSLDKHMHDIASRICDKTVIFSHPVYQYLERAYRIKGRSLHWEPDEKLGERKLSELKLLLGLHPAGLLIWESEPLTSITEQLASLGLQTIVFVPSGNRPASGDFLSVMKQNVENLEKALGN